MTQYLHHTSTETDVDPDKVDVTIYGRHNSLVRMGRLPAPNRRMWAFESREGRDLFLLHVSEGKLRK